MGQPPEGAPASASPYTGVDAAKDEQRNQEARRSAYAAEIRKFLRDHPEATLDEAMGAREKEFREKHGEEYGGNKWLAGLTKEGIAAYESGSKDWGDRLAKAREGDLASAKERKGISNSLIGVIARANPAIPIEEIAKLTEGDPLIKLLGQGALGQDEKLRTELLRLVGTGIKTSSDERNTLTRANATVEASENAANAANAKKKTGGGAGRGGGGGATRAVMLAEDVAAHPDLFPEGMSMKDAALAMAGQLDTSELSPEAQQYLERRVGHFNTLSSKGLDAYHQKQTGRDPGLEAQKDTSIERQAQNVKETKKERDAVLRARRAVGSARQAWKKVDPTKQALIVQIGGDAGQLAKAFQTGQLTPDDQKAFALVQTLINKEIKELSGASVTGQEWRRMADAIGLTDGTYNPYRSPEVLSGFLDKAWTTYKEARSSAQAAYPDLWKGYKDVGP